MNINTQNPIRIAAAVALFAALTSGAHADDVRQVHVNYADLNVQTTAGATVLYQRIRGAAGRVCDVPDNRDIARLDPAKACAAHAIADAVAAVNTPALTAVYEFRIGRTPVARLATVR